MDARPQPHPLPSLAPLLPVLPPCWCGCRRCCGRTHFGPSVCAEQPPYPQPRRPQACAERLLLVLHGHSLDGTSRRPVQAPAPPAPALPPSALLYLHTPWAFFYHVCFCGDVHLSPRMCARRGRAAAVLSVPVRAQLAAETNEREDRGARSPAQIRSGCAVGVRNRRCLCGWGENGRYDRRVSLRWLMRGLGGGGGTPPAPWWPTLALPPHAGTPETTTHLLGGGWCSWPSISEGKKEKGRIKGCLDMRASPRSPRVLSLTQIGPDFTWSVSCET